MYSKRVTFRYTSLYLSRSIVRASSNSVEELGPGQLATESCLRVYPLKDKHGLTYIARVRGKRTSLYLRLFT